MPEPVLPARIRSATLTESGSDKVLPSLRRQMSLYAAGATIIILLIVGVLTSIWLWQVKDWGIETTATGVVIAVQPGSAAAEAGIRPDDVVDFADLQQLKTLSGRVAEGAQVTVVIERDRQRRPVTLRAQASSLARQIELSVATWVGIGFILLGIAPLIARRRTFTLWMLFLTDVTTGLFLIAEGPRPLHLAWAELVAYATVTIFPAVIFHFHTLFPRQQLGRWHRPIILAVYGCAAVLTVLNLYALGNGAFDRDPMWTFILRTYLVGCLGASFILIVSGYRTQDPRVRTQIKIIVLCGGSGLLANVILLGLAAVLSAEVRRTLENLGVLAALTTPFGYAYAMLRYSVLIEGLLWRRWLIRAALASLLFLGGLALALTLLGNRPITEETVPVFALLVMLGALLLGVIYVALGEWVEHRLFRGGSYVDLLDYATRELTRFQKLEDYRSFFTEVLPARLKSSGAALFLAEQQEDTLRLVACSSTLRLPCVVAAGEGLATRSDLGQLLAAAQGPVPLANLLLPHVPVFPEDNARLLECLRAGRVELLLPLVAGPQVQLIGLVALAAKETDEGYSGQELAALAALARTAATAAENVLLFERQQQQLADLAALARRVSTEQDEASKRIARELHDSTLQELGVLSRALTGVREEVQELLTRCEELALEMESQAVREAPEQVEAQMLAVLNELQVRLGILLGEDTRLTARLPTETEHAAALESRPTVEDLIGQARATAQRIREICNDLHPTYLDDPISVTLRRSVEQFRKRQAGVRIEWELVGTEPTELGDDVKVTCKRITDLAIHNALLHGHPMRIEITLTFAPDQSLTLQVTDDGVGFTPRSQREWRASKHHGLANMHERAELIGGKLYIESAAGHGTHITLYVPPQSASAEVTPPAAAAITDDRRLTGESNRYQSSPLYVEPG